MFFSRGTSTRGLTGVQCPKSKCGKRRGPRGGVCAPARHRHNNISRKKCMAQHLTGHCRVALLCDLREGIQTRSLEQKSPITWQPWMQKNRRLKEKGMHIRVVTRSVSMRADLCFACCTEFNTHTACARICTTRQITPRKLTIAWCHDHVVCGTRSAHEGAPSGMLFHSSTAKSSFSLWFLLPEPVTHVRG